MMINTWKIVTLILGVMLIITNVIPAITGLFVLSNEVVSVELFVMSHCPFGTQAEKGILPAIQALGSNVDFKLRFVDYVMHGKPEIDEQLVQHCIQEEQPTKLIPYLNCFLEAGDGTGCLNSLNINVDSCVAATDAEFNVTNLFNDQSTWLSGYYPLFPVDDALNEQYKVQSADGRWGSPQIVINGVLTQVYPRSPQSYLTAICEAFTNAPSACNQALSNVNPSSGFGFSGSGSNSEGSCG